jgi:hypothetical protein
MRMNSEKLDSFVYCLIENLSSSLIHTSANNSPDDEPISHHLLDFLRAAVRKRFQILVCVAEANLKRRFNYFRPSIPIQPCCKVWVFLLHLDGAKVLDVVYCFLSFARDVVVAVVKEPLSSTY